MSLQEQYMQLQQERQQQLLGLPLPALKQLLQDPRTKVASENTVWYTLDRWCKHQAAKSARRKAAAATASAKAARTGAAGGDATHQHTAEVMELASLVRLPHCSASYLPMVISRSTLAAAAFTAEALAVAALLQQQPQLHSELRAAWHPVVVKFTAWQLGRRPASAVKFLRLQWKLPVQQICHLLSERTAPAADNNAAGSQPDASAVGYSTVNQSSSGIAASTAIPTLQREQTQAWCRHEFGLAVTLGQQGQQQLLSLVCVMRASWGQVH
jgi:hypothetical protein